MQHEQSYRGRNSQGAFKAKWPSLTGGIALMFRRVDDKNVKFHNEVGKFRKFARGDIFSEGK